MWRLLVVLILGIAVWIGWSLYVELASGAPIEEAAPEPLKLDADGTYHVPPEMIDELKKGAIGLSQKLQEQEKELEQLHRHQQDLGCA